MPKVFTRNTAASRAVETPARPTHPLPSGNPLGVRSPVQTIAPAALTVAQTAEVYQVSTETIYRAIRAGELRTVRMRPNGIMWIPVVELQRWASGS